MQMLSRVRRLTLAVTVLACLQPRAAAAKPTAPTVVCATLPSSADCAAGVPDCTLCHESTDPAAWNSFGLELKMVTAGRADFDAALTEALAAVGGNDADGDGASNADELMQGTRPGSPDQATASDAPAGDNSRFDLDGYDPRFALRRLMILYCGRSPSYRESQALASTPPTQAAEQLHARLNECLRGDYWQKTALPRLADKRIRPLTAAGTDTRILIAGRRLVIGDYNYDYRLWRYILSEDRDMRELLTAKYHVVEEADGTLVPVNGVIAKANEDQIAGGQLVPDEHRAGMLTTQWFFAINTMFSALPRTTAAQAYRSYLGADISMNEGLRPVAGEPLDIDDKGVSQERCANCHSTLDPLSYAFAEYEGIQVSAETAFGAYNPARIQQMLPKWDASKQKSVLLGQPVANVVEWGEVAANSDEFKHNMAMIFFRHALGREPSTTIERSDFQKLRQSIAEDGFSANKLIHRLVDTMTFGGP